MDCRNLKWIFLFFLIVLGTGAVFAQVGNEWINFSQQYFKIPVARDGMYRLTATNLQAAGLPATTDPRHIQIFHRGKEQAIFVQGEADGQLNSGDFVEFFGQKNDGTVDRELYKPATAQPHNYKNLYSDSTAYFLTIGSAVGKRMDTYSSANPGLSPQSFHLDERLLVLAREYSFGADYNEVVNSFFDEAEGLTDFTIFQNDFGEYNFSDLSGLVTTAGIPEVEMIVLGRGPMNHQFEVYVGAGQRLAATYTFSGYTTFRVTLPLQWSDISGGQIPVRVKVIGIGGQPDRISVSVLRLTYAQRPDMASVPEKNFILRPSGGQSYVEIQNPTAGTQLYNITDKENPVRVSATLTTTLNAVVPSSTETRLLATTTFTTPSIRRVSFRQITPSQHDYIIISHPVLRRPAGGYSDPVAAYGAYRASAEGGNYDTLVVNIGQLFDQFSYGEPTSVAIFHFMKFLTDAKVPKYLLLIGKGLDVSMSYYLFPQLYLAYPELVPTAGSPGSDMAFTAGLAGTKYEPAVPTGRISATTGEQVANYLNKVKETESLPYNDLWRKNIMHLSGGIYDGEPQLFRSYMQEFQKIAESPYFGAKVSALAKQSKEISLINIAQQVNKGLSFVSFFGHASSTTLDFDLGMVTDPVQGYSNKGRYPTLLMSGCQVGAYFSSNLVFGEDWLMAKDRGAIGFIGHSSFGFTSTLRKYAEIFYQVAYGDSAYVHKGLGDIQKETARRYMLTSGEFPINTTQVQQMVLLGDPAVSLFGARRADLETNENHVSFHSFDGGPITAVSDSFAINMIIRNFGQAPPDTVRIEVQRILEDNSIISYDSLFPVTRYSDTLTFVIRQGANRPYGANVFRIAIDPDNVIDEYSKTNNVVTKNLLIASNATKNLYPSPYAIVNRRDVSLAIQATDLLSEEREFLIELDTTNTFDSPYRQQLRVKGKLLARLQIQILEEDTTAYYWRTRFAQPAPGELDQWMQSSFTYIAGDETGWAQVHFPQYTDNVTVGLVKDSDLRRIEYLRSTQTVDIRTYGSQFANYYDSMRVRLSGMEYFRSAPGFECRPFTLNLIAFDRKSTAPYLGVPLEWFNRAGRTCGRDPAIINSYHYTEMTTSPGTDLLAYIDNIETGDSVVLFNVGPAYYNQWPTAAITKLGELGISQAQLSGLEDDEPFVIFGRKGDAPGAATVFRTSGSPVSSEKVSVSNTITGGYADGSMSSGLIGPALSWKAIHLTSRELQESDTVRYDVIGVRQNGSEVTLYNDQKTDRDIAMIDPLEFPYLKVSFRTSDDTYLTSAQLSNWIVTYEPGPEGILVYNGIRSQEEFAEGERWSGKYGFINISEKSFRDSLTVQYEVFNQPSLNGAVSRMKVRAPAPGDTVSFSLNVETTGIRGLNDVEVFVNPRIQPELYYDNNQLNLAAHLNVTGDILEPVLEVLVDGRHLISDDFVSPQPTIIARIWDESHTLLKKDTAGVRVFLTYPCADQTCPPTRILLSDATVKWFAATDVSDFKVVYTPAQLADGNYTLRIEGADANGNTAGVDPYVVAFVVKNDVTITVDDPYPNPVTRDDVNFRIVLTGNTTVDVMDLDLFNVNGTAGEHFTMADFPALYVGMNELTWNGFTRSGNRLPNGIYVYRITLQAGGQRLQKIGKLVVLR